MVSVRDLQPGNLGFEACPGPLHLATLMWLCIIKNNKNIFDDLISAITLERKLYCKSNHMMCVFALVLETKLQIATFHYSVLQYTISNTKNVQSIFRTL